MAPKARIAFTDLLKKGSGVIKFVFFSLKMFKTLDLPADLSTHYFPDPYNVGARIHSSSWGTNINAYTTQAFEIDKFTWEHKDFLPFFAAGNTGEKGDNNSFNSYHFRFILH